MYESFFEPKHMAVIGVSLTNDRHPANIIYNKNRLRYPVNVYPINPKGGTILGETVYQSIGDVPEQVDLAVIAVGAEHVAKVLKECINAGAKAGVIVSGGFSETGRTDLQDEISALANDANFPFVGPNCLGVYSPGFVNTLFLPGERMVTPSEGNVSLVSQSGGVLVDQLVKFSLEGVGVSRAVSIGNKAGLDECDLLEFLVDDPKTNVLAFYVEGFDGDEGRRFLEAAKASPKPVIALKAGKSETGRRAISTHTASLAGDYEVFQGVLSQHGVVEARDELELVSYCEVLSCYQNSIAGSVAVVSGSGGHGALAVDTCAAHGLAVPMMSEKMQEELLSTVSPSIRNIASMTNPFDLTGSAVDDDFVTVTKFISTWDDIDCIIMLLLPYIPGITSDVGARLSEISYTSGKPLVAYVPHVERYRMLIEGFELNGIPVSPSIHSAVLMAEALKKYRRAQGAGT